MSSSEEDEDEGEEIASLDTQIEIMKRLPVKSLIRFRAVSKQWKSIIQSSRFIADYNSTPHIQPRNHFIAGYRCSNYAILFNDIRIEQRLTLPNSADFRSFRNPKSIGYCQGLFGFHNDKDRLVIWNPSIRKSVFAPLPVPDYGSDFGFTVVGNATEPTVFNIICDDKHPQLQVQILTLSTGVWTTFSNSPRESLEFTRRMVVIDRFIHWIAYDEDDRYLILSCDITSEQFTELYLPPTIAAPTSYIDFEVSPSFEVSPRYLDLSKLKGSLVLLEEDVCEKEIGVWMMMMEPGVQTSFTKLYTVNLPADAVKQQPNVLGFTKDGQLLILIEFYLRNPRLHLYEPDSKCFKDIGILGEGCYSHLAGSYMETLLLLDH